MGKINKGDMRFVLHDGVARFAYGSPDAGATTNTYVLDSQDQSWHLLPASVTGTELVPLHISKDGRRMWAIHSAHGGPEELVSAKLDGSDRKTLLSDSFASVSDILWAPHHGAPYAASLAVGRPQFIALNDSPLAQVQKALSDKFPNEVSATASSVT